ncbi:MAG: hypothetical protein GC150_14260 [Rhizobiales bacterium]|nr:hypothetical protein [Hyphomicrobiales bacterium]
MPDPSEQSGVYLEDRSDGREAATSRIMVQEGVASMSGRAGAAPECRKCAVDIGPSAKIGALITNDIVPRLRDAHARNAGSLHNGASSKVLRAGPSAAGGRVMSRIGRDRLERFTGCVAAGDGSGARAEIAFWLKQGCAADDIAIEALGFAATVFGDAWLSDRMNFFEVTVRMTSLHLLLRELPCMPTVHTNRTPRSILLASVPGEGHVLGVDIVASLFSRAGWQVAHLAGTATDAELIAEVAAVGYTAIGLSASTPELLAGLTRLLVDLKRYAANPEMSIMIGGLAVRERSDVAFAVGADAAIADGRLAVASANALADERADPRAGCPT